MLLDLLTTPCFSNSKKSRLAAASLSASNRLYLAATGRPSVSIWCHTLCFTSGSTFEGFSTAGNSSNSLE